MENRFSNSLQNSKFKVWRKGEDGMLSSVETQGLQKYKGKCTRCHETLETSNTGTVKLNFLKTCTAAVILYGLHISGIEDKIPCHNLHLIKPKRNIKIAETICNLCRTLWRWDATAFQQPETREMDIQQCPVKVTSAAGILYIFCWYILYILNRKNT